MCLWFPVTITLMLNSTRQGAALPVGMILRIGISTTWSLSSFRTMVRSSRARRSDILPVSMHMIFTPVLQVVPLPAVIFSPSPIRQGRKHEHGEIFRAQMTSYRLGRCQRCKLGRAMTALMLWFSPTSQELCLGHFIEARKTLRFQ